ncbi:4-hydroxybenzoate polyprenyltransferase [Paraoerskovia marina]|uniref:4-hydroxybenzoate polyprenyltransferase n=1 Tax=Paraoerskovia marina TaxID=545619 RepID=A0A1H1MFT5_9CELL|nr:UbiA family prenyltransferase [Paraoerskovia marina]SDR85235.1 4-hydroxybenzoate polyprenyltransferase [Paraoerskovia marina]
MSRRAQLQGLVVASHAGPTTVVTLLALSLAAGVGESTARVALVGAAVLAGQLSVGWSNDWLDANRDRLNHRTDKPAVVGAVTVPVLRRAALGALGVCVLLSFAAGWWAGALHVSAVLSAWAYNLWAKRTVWSWLPYAVSFGLLPAFVVAAGGDGRTVAPWTVLAAALLGVGAHIANALPDFEDDHRTGIRGLPHRIGPLASSILSPALLVVATFVIIANGSLPTEIAVGGAVASVALAAGAGVIALVRPTSRLPFPLSMAVAVVCVVLLVFAAPSVVR